MRLVKRVRSWCRARCPPKWSEIFGSLPPDLIGICILYLDMGWRVERTLKFPDFVILDRGGEVFRATSWRGFDWWDERKWVRCSSWDWHGPHAVRTWSPLPTTVSAVSDFLVRLQATTIKWLPETARWTVRLSTGKELLGIQSFDRLQLLLVEPDGTYEHRWVNLPLGTRAHPFLCLNERTLLILQSRGYLSDPWYSVFGCILFLDGLQQATRSLLSLERYLCEHLGVNGVQIFDWLLDSGSLWIACRLPGATQQAVVQLEMYGGAACATSSAWTSRG
jgi:hypothetical protein